MDKPLYQRVLLKLSGEALMGDNAFGISQDILEFVALEVSKAHATQAELGIVLGGGNIFRGVSHSARNMDRVQADNMGMLATVINSLALQDALERHAIPTRVMSAINMPQVAEPFIRRRAIRHLEKRRVVIFAAGIGNPYFSTDTAAALRAQEIGAQVLLKATKVEGIYDSDPVKNPDAQKYDHITYDRVLTDRLDVMDATAVSLARDNKLPVLIFNMLKADNIRNIILGHKIGSRVED
ncbi:MAG: UMP kinase [Desulfarculales bacterium]|jgi:uridylate kinase|nr:UMP kinase [Desulfarculales bacterium]